MTVSELIEKLSEMDPHREVKVCSPTGGYKHINDVNTELERSPYDQDFDTYVVVID